MFAIIRRCALCTYSITLTLQIEINENILNLIPINKDLNDSIFPRNIYKKKINKFKIIKTT